MSDSQRLQSYGYARQRQAKRQADGAAAAADRAILMVWRDVLGLLAQRRPWPEVQPLAHRLFAGLFVDINKFVARRLEWASDWSWRSAVYVLRRSLPKTALARAVMEDESGIDALNFTDLFDLLFPPPAAADVHRIVFGGDWQARLTSLSRLAPPFELANLVGAGVAAGKSQQEIARDLMPLVNRIRSSARRIARTEALRIAGAMNMRAHEQLGDLVIGFQVFSAHVPDSRSWHVARSGTIYYKDPKPSQKGMEQMPNPPDEARDPAERPPGTPQTAPNCLCHLVPVLRD